MVTLHNLQFCNGDEQFQHKSLRWTSVFVQVMAGIVDPSDMPNPPDSIDRAPGDINIH